MAPKAQFVVQPFRMDGQRMIPGQQVIAKSEAQAIEQAERLAQRAPAVIAFEVENDKAADIYGEPRIFFRSGKALEEEVA
jgi:hypothetical protein